MDIIVLILSAVSAVCALAAAVFAYTAGKKASDKSDNGELAALSAKIDVMHNTISTEISNSRQENSKSMLEIAERNDRQNEKITAALELSVDKLTKSNEKKLEEMRTTISTEISGSRRENTKSMLEIADRNDKQNEKITAAVEVAVDKLTKSNEKKLDEMRATVDEKLTSTLTTRLDSSFKTVSDQLEKLYKSLGEMKELSGGVTANVTSLNKILTNVKARGTWAEYQLESILDQTVPNMYVKNYQPAGSRDFVEFAVKLPSGEDSSQITYLPVDSKFPMEDYARLCSAADEADSEAVENARKALEKRVLSEAKDVSKYINPPETTPFAIMYLATEGLYAEIASSKNGLLEKIQNEYSVMIAGPTTVTALLNSVSMGLRTLAVNEKANEIKVILGAVKKQYDMFDVALKKVKKKISEADSSIDDAAKRNEIIQKKLKNIDSTDSIASDSILGIAQSDYE